jgi:hypothetical protein
MQLRQLGFRPNAAKFSLQEGKLIAVLDFTAAISDSQSSAIRDALP